MYMPPSLVRYSVLQATNKQKGTSFTCCVFLVSSKKLIVCTQNKNT